MKKIKTVNDLYGELVNLILQGFGDCDIAVNTADSYRDRKILYVDINAKTSESEIIANILCEE